MKCCKRCRATKPNTKTNQATNEVISPTYNDGDKKEIVAGNLSANVQNDEYLFCSEAEMNNSLKKLCYGNLYVIGKIWVEGLKSVLVGSKFCLFPTIEAEEPTKNERKTPVKPPPMKLTDLSLYSSPHYEYKECVSDNQKLCDVAELDSRGLKSYLYPIVREKRLAFMNLVSDSYKTVANYVSEVKDAIRNQKDKLLNEARNPEYYLARQGFVASSALLGFVVGRRLGKYKDSILRGLILSGLATLASGALCFPVETDRYFTDICYHSAKTGLRIYNIYANDNKTIDSVFICDAEKLARPCRIEPPPYKES